MFSGKPSTSDYHASNRAQADMYRQRVVSEFTERVNVATFVNAVHGRAFDAYVRDRLKEQFHPDTFEQLKVDVRTNVNVLADIVAKLSVAWAEGASYVLEDDAGAYADPDGAFAGFLAQADLDNVARTQDVMTRLHPRTAVGPAVTYQERSDQHVLTWAVHDPTTFNLVPCAENPADYSQLDTYGWADFDGVMRQVKTAWCSDVVRRFVLSSRQTWDTVSEEENPYGLIPFVLFGGSAPVSSPWLPCIGPELADVTVSVCCAETLLANQSLGQIKVLAGEFKEFPRGQVLRHNGVVNVGDAQSINILDFQTDVTRFADTFIQRPRRNALVSVGLPSDEFETSGTPPSGEALKLRYSNRDRAAIHKRPYLKASIVELFWLTQHVLAVKMGEVDDDGRPVTVRGIPGTVPYDVATRTSPLRLTVDVNEITYPELAAERATSEDRELALGLTSVVDLYMQRNPDATREQAVRAVVGNRALNVRLSDAASMRRAGPVLLRTQEGGDVEGAVLAR